MIDKLTAEGAVSILEHNLIRASDLAVALRLAIGGLEISQDEREALTTVAHDLEALVAHSRKTCAAAA